MVSDNYKDCLKYIASYWNKIIKNPEIGEERNNFIYIPCPYIVPNDNKFNYIFYWDTFFMFRGLIGNKKTEVMKYMVENFIYLFKKYKIIPNFNSHTSVNRSQPPFLTSMIFDVYNETGDKNWLKNKIEIVKQEYLNVWSDPNKIFHHKVENCGLNRYGDTDVGYAQNAELESGWDFTSRFYNRCDEFLPVDLNSYLFKYEEDFARTAEILGDQFDMNYWQRIAWMRKMQMNKFMWNQNEGFFYDFDYINMEQSQFLSLAGFTPLWAGLAEKEQAELMVKKLPEFETDFGLTITSCTSLLQETQFEKIPESYRKAINYLFKPKQWDYPNIWPPLEYLTVIGLLKYGFISDAKRIMKKSLDVQTKIFRKYNTFFEKIDGEKGDKSKSYHYANQSGFGWTNAIFYRYVKILEAIESKKNIYQTPKSKFPPFDLSILH